MPGLHDRHGQPPRCIAGPSGVSKSEAEGSGGTKVAGRAWRKPKGHPRGALDGREVRQDRLGRLVGPSRRVLSGCSPSSRRRRIEVSSRDIEVGVEIDPGLVGAETDPETWVVSGRETAPEARRKPAPGFCFLATCEGDISNAAVDLLARFLGYPLGLRAIARSLPEPVPSIVLIFRLANAHGVFGGARPSDRTLALRPPVIRPSAEQPRFDSLGRGRERCA